MLLNRRRLLGALVAAGLVVTAWSAVEAQLRADVTINDTMVMPESLTSSEDGTVFFGSTTKGNIYRATPGAAQAEAWIQASTTGLTNVLGVLADDKASTLWVCSNATGGRGTPPTGQTALRAFDLKSGAPKDTWAFPNGGFCNDIAVAGDGTAYATDTNGRRVLRLRPGGTALDVWIADQQLNGLDGVAILDGSVYVNCFFSGELFRATIQPDGTAGPLTKIETSMPFTRPDGLRTAGSNKLLQAEGQGRLTELTITGTRADVRVLKDGLTGATAVTRVGDLAFVLVERLRAVPVPYPAR
jgi:sugar lactone lactonase YvrE